MKKIFFFFLILFFFQNFSIAEDVNYYLVKAEKLKLYDLKKWNRLLHYKNSISILSGGDFFLSKNGSFDKKSELFETIKAFYIPNNQPETEIYQHPLCKYPARFDFLNKYLHFTNLPKVDCKRYNDFIHRIRPESLTLIFPTSYINNPASMFGHTLLRIDQEDSYQKKTFINSVVVNFGADTKGETNGIIYAFRGIFGLYDGFFSVFPYFKMTNMYNNSENRDIWEYKLTYTKEESIFYTKHIWELLNAKSSYYFFKENCAYQILESLNILRNDIDLNESFVFYTAPISTIKILRKNNLIETETYRPSLQKKIEEESKYISDDDIKKIKLLLKKNKKVIFDSNYSYKVAYNFLEYNKIKDNINLYEYRQKSFFLLQKISLFDIKDKTIKQPDLPEMGHNIGKYGISYGVFDNEEYLQLSFKPVYHELIDSLIGYDYSSEINFFNTELRYFTQKKKIELEKIDFIKIKSLPVYTKLFHPTSFTVLFGLNNLYDNYKTLLLDVNGGFTIGNKNFSTFLLFGPKIESSFDMNNLISVGFNNNIGIRINTQFLNMILN